MSVRASLVRRFSVSLVALLFVAAPAWAEPSTDEIARARRLFEDATELEAKGEWAEAKRQLVEALAIKETPGLYFHLAHCEVKLGELVLALEHYERARALIASGSTAPDVERLLGPAREELLERAPRLTLIVRGDNDGAKVEIDGETLAHESLRSPVLLDPGRHRVVVRAPGRREFAVEVTLEERQARTLEVSLPTSIAEPASAPLPVRAPAAERPTRGEGIGAREVVLVGEATLAAAGLAVGIGFTFARASASDRVDRAQGEVDRASGGAAGACFDPSSSPACADLHAALDDYDRASVIQTVGFVGAAALVGAGALTWTLWPERDERASLSFRSTASGALLSLEGRY